MTYPVELASGNVIRFAGDLTFTGNQPPGLFGIAGSVAAGSTTVALTGGNPSGIVNGSYVAIGAYALGCELRRVTVSGNTLTLNQALEQSHPIGSLVYVANDNVFSPLHFGADPSTSTFDSWQAIQQALYQASKLLANAGNYGPIIDAENSTFRVSQPLTFGQHTLRNFRSIPLAGFAPLDANNAMMLLGKNHVTFTATASDNTFVSASALPNLNEPLVFSNMYGETLPGGVVSGRVYYVRTRVDAFHITVSDTVGGTELDVTSDGGGWYCGQVGELSKCWWDNVSLVPNLADLNGAVLGLQQPAEIKRLRIDHTVDCTRTTYGLVIPQAQIARIINPEFVPQANNVIALGIAPAGTTWGTSSTTGVHVQDSNFAGTGKSGQVHISVGGGTTCDGIVIDGQTWLESPGESGIKIQGTVRNLAIGDLYCSGSPTVAMVNETNTNSSWRVGQIIQASSSKVLVSTGDATPILFKTFGSADSVETDSDFVFGGMRRPSAHGPILSDRYYTAVSADFTMRYIDKTIDVSAAGGARTVTLRSAAGMSGHRVLIRKSETSANTVTVDAAGSETINGSLTYVLAGGAIGFVEIESTGTNWIIVNAA